MDIQAYYRNEEALLRAERDAKKTEQALRQAKYDCREMGNAVIEYEGSLRALLDRLSGKREEKLEKLRRKAEQAEQQLAMLTGQKKRLQQELELLRQQVQTLPPPEVLRAEADPLLWAQLEAKLCAEALAPLLEENCQALEEYRAQLRGERMGEIVSRERLHEIGTAHIASGRSCGQWMQRLQPAMEILGKGFEVPGYYQNPAGFIASAAARHNRLDRMNEALDQLVAVRRMTKELLGR